MITADTGVIWKVVGKRREMAATGPRPGRTPTRVPIKTPTKQKNRFPGERATWKPIKTLWKKSNSSFL
jgi:hypothetical protein